MDFSEIKIQVIDNDKDNLFIIKTLIKESFPNAVFLTAKDGIEGIDIAIKNFPDVIIIKPELSEMDGFEICKKLKSNQNLREIPVLMITDHLTGKFNKILAIESGVEAFITKPFDSIEIKAQIRAMIKIKNAKHENFNSDKYAKAFQSSPYAIIITRAKDGQCIECNDAFAAISGFSREETYANTSIGLNLWHNVNDRKWVVSELIKGNNISDKEFIFRKKDGTLINSLYTAQLININNETCILSSINDVTEALKAKQKAEDLSKKQKILADALIIMNQAKDISELYEYLGQSIYSVLEDAYVICVKLDKDHKVLRVIQHFGTSSNIHKFSELLGLDLADFGVKLNDYSSGELELLKQEKIIHISSGIKGLVGKNLNKTICKTIEKLFGISSVYTMGISWNNQIYGGIGILYKKERDISNSHLFIESLVRNASIIIQRRWFEKELLENEKKYRLITEKISDVVWLMDLSGKSLFVSPSIKNFTGYTVEEYLNQTINDCLTSESAELAITTLKKEIGIYTSYKTPPRDYIKLMVFDYKCKDGSIKTGEVLVNPYYSESDELIGIQGVTRDITERKHAEVALLQSEKRFQNLAEISPVGIFRTDAQGSTTYVNPRWCEISGLSAEQALSDGWLNAVHPDDKENIKNGWQEATLKQTHSFSEYRFIGPNGRLAWVMGQAVPEKDINGQVVAYVGSITEITERKLAEEALKETFINLEQKANFSTNKLIRSEEIYRTTVDSINDWVFVVDKNLKLISINKALKNFLGTNGLNENFINKNIKDVFVFLKDEDFETIKSMFVTGKEISSESEYKVFDKLYYTQRVISPVIENEKVIRVVVTVHDYSNIKKIEEDMRKTLGKEKELNLLKSRFISTVSHEFRTPLAGILSSVQLLKRYGNKWDEEKKEKFYKQIFDAVHHTKTLLDDVSIIDKEQSNKLSFRPSNIELRPLILQIIEENTQIYGENCKINLHFDINQTSVYLDHAMVRHIFSNLLSNALKYRGDSKDVDFTIKEKNENSIEFVIVDRGIGIPDKDQKFLFEPFHRASNVEGIQGTGFGMSVVKRFVELHNGSIDVKSKLGFGTTVTVVLPFIQEA